VLVLNPGPHTGYMACEEPTVQDGDLSGKGMAR
jgi:hypothetical protein